MNEYTIADIRALDPCYDPAKYLPEDWTGTALDILRVTDCPAQDRLWVVCNQGWIDDRTMRLFAVWCARQALAVVDNPDPRSIAACDVAERYANGQATDDELDAAWAAAEAASLAAAWAAAWDAAWAASWAASWAAAWDAALAASWAAAWAAARDAASAAAWGAARDAALAAASAAARDAAWAAQIEHLIEMLEAEEARP